MQIVSRDRGFDICYDEKSEEARSLVEEIANNSFFSPTKRSVVVVGGDGTMLEAVHRYSFDGVFLGINCGHRGFLLNDPDIVFGGRLMETYEFPLLEIESDTGWKGWAMGDVYFNRITGQACKIKVSVDGTVIAERIVGDGIVISTPLGSGRFFGPAGGSALHPRLKVIGFAPIVRNLPFQIMPIVFPIDSVFDIELLSPPSEVKGFYDGGDRELPYFSKIRVKKAEQTVKLAFCDGEDFTARLVSKIMKVQEGQDAYN